MVDSKQLNSIPEHILLNNKILDANGNVQDLEQDRLAVRSYFLNHINNKTKFFHDLKEKLDYLVDNGYYEKEFLEKYDFKDIKKIYNYLYSKKFRFSSYMSAFKFYNDYALKSRTEDKVYLERYEDRLAVIALYYGDGDYEKAKRIAKSLIQQDFTPATPTLLNTGKKSSGAKVSCFPKGTLITTRDGIQIPIEELKVGDEVLTHLGRYKKITDAIVTEGNHEIFGLRVSGLSTLELTPNHPVLVYSKQPDDNIPSVFNNALPSENYKWVEAQKVRPLLDYVVSPFIDIENNSTEIQGEFRKVTDVGYLKDVDTVYNLEVEDDHSYVANNIAVHNCFLTEISDDLNSISRVLETSMQLSKLGGGVSIFLENLRARGESIKGIPNVAKGVVPVAKLLDNAFRYADQMGQRQGSGAAYISVFHSDIEDFLNTKKINVDEDIRLKTLSIGVCIPNLFMEKAKNDEDYYVFYPGTVEKEFGKPFGEITAEMSKWYNILVENPNVRKRKLNARSILQLIASVQGEAGYPYVFFTDNVNRQRTNKGLVKFSNLCVAPNTKILTQNSGYQAIYKFENQFVNIWNGEQWSDVKVVKTGEMQKLLKVTTDNYKVIECTPYHKFYVTSEDSYGIIEKRAHELNEGDKLIKFNLPNEYKHYIEDELSYSYENGFYSGDGCEYVVKNRKNLINKIIYLYGNKRDLLSKFNHTYAKQVQNNRILLTYSKGLRDKFFVPRGFKIEYIVKWLSGLLDADGTVLKQNGNYSVQLANVNLNFLNEILLMLQEIGIHSSIKLSIPEKHYLMPNGRGTQSLYLRKNCYRLFITHKELQKLILLGLKTYRLELNDVLNYTPNREARQYEKILKIEEVSELKDTYCFTEPIRNMGMFNGLLTGNCTEIIQPTTPTKFKDYDEAQEDEIGLGISCNLSSLNIDSVMRNNTLEETIQNAMHIMTKVSEETSLKFAKDIEKANRIRRSVGLGAMGLHSYLAKNYIAYGSEESLDFVDVFFNILNYYSLKYSNELAKEKGSYFDFENSSYANGEYFKNRGMILPKTEKVKQLFEKVYIPTNEDWKQLKKDVMKYGLFHSERLAIAPTGSISYVMSQSASVMPIKQLVEERTYGNSKTYFPMPYVDTHGFMYETAYDLDSRKIMRVIATIQKHIDQGISLELCEVSNGTTRDLIKNIIYAHHIGLKTLYYTRTKKLNIQECIACAV